MSGKESKQEFKEGGFPVLGCGVGLRPCHYQHILDHQPKSIDWFEAVSENYMDTEGRPVHLLEEIRKSYSIGLHGVSLSLGSADPFNKHYLDQLKQLCERIEPALVSDHLCWASIGKSELHDLLPLPMTEEGIPFFVNRINEVQNHLGRQILIENVSSYVTYKHSTVPEHEFIAEVAKRAGCGILLDINNIYVNSKNHGFDTHAYIDHIPGHLVGQFHIAGHLDRGKFLFDTHGGHIIDDVWKLYEYAMSRYGQVSSLIEWDTGIPDFPELEAENERSRSYYNQFTIHRGDLSSSTKTSGGETQDSSNFQKELRDLQVWFKNHVEACKADESSTINDDEVFNPQNGDPGKDRLKVYAEGYLVNTKDALSEVYEAIERILGENSFTQLAYDYAHHQRSSDYNLGHRGDALPEFIKTHPLSSELPFLPDLAKLEQMLAKAYHAQHQPALDPQTLAQLPPEQWGQATLSFQPFVFILKSEWPIYDLWQARHAEKIDVDLANRPQQVLVSRRMLDSHCESITLSQYLLLHELLSGKTLEQAFDALASQNEELPVTEWFADWTKRGLFTRINTYAF